MSNYKIVLASTSPFRRQLLEQTGLTFSAIAPEVDETPVADESATELVERLAKAKACAVAEQFKDNTQALVIGSDQVAVVNGSIVGKPHTHEKAVAQLTAASGQAVTFYTGLAVAAVTKGTISVESCVETFEVVFRNLTAEEIEGYLRKEQPYQCAGSFKSEALGITLFSALRGNDPNALVGLPVIRLLEMLRVYGVNPLLDTSADTGA
ncbi:MAF protein [Pseudidiomarina planktonica]|uniref:7-methyl-GTP pyrophosphatase n=1 Tax=Pseudidiomarina planktonica TaxID=1323738 RepID=A0A1Y6ERS6_9GAMM|nr:nucleoside triphosphate pyrophosphatase [Pseudidiomarina planktonica]RUO65343.1 septum formation inhibitor Maf [Pseudidiomarina planktonica]SMQ65405.1 MAF protein [Pseudidiomarina planktonica]